MACEFFVVMQKRSDGKVYADLHKTDGRMYLTEEDADAAIMEIGDLAKRFHKVKMVGVLADEWNARVQAAAEGSRACNDLLGAAQTTEKGNGE